MKSLDDEIDELTYQWKNEALEEEFHHKHPGGNSHMRFWHKSRRLELEDQIRRLTKIVDTQRRFLNLVLST